MDIRNSISLTDRMTPVFKSINKAMMSTLQVMQRMDSQTSRGAQSKAYRQAEKDIKRANNELIKMTNHLHKADNAAKGLEKATGGIHRSMRGFSGFGFNLVNLSAGLYLLRNIASALGNLMETPDTMNAIAYRLGLYDTTGATNQELFASAAAAALGSRSDLASTGNLASRILISGGTNGSGEEAIQLASTINKASFLGGSSAGESQRALLQLSQALASGALQGDELRAIREQAPGLTDALSKGLSKLYEQGLLPESFEDVTIGKLKELGAEGELTASRIIAAFQAMGPEINEMFENSPKQFGQAMTQVKTIWQYFLQLLSQNGGALDKINKAAWQFVEYMQSPEGVKMMSQLADVLGTVADAVLWAFGKIADGIQWLSDHEDTARSIFVGLGAAAAVAGASAAAAWVKAAWPILAVAAAFGVLNHYVDDTSTSSNELVGYLMAGLSTLGAVIVDILIVVAAAVTGALAVIWDALVWVVVAAVWAVQAVVQAFLWLWGIVITILEAIYAVFITVFGGLYVAISVVVNSIVAAFLEMARGVVGILDLIARAIDAVFGSNLSEATTGWMNRLGELAGDALAQIGKDAEDFAGATGEVWSEVFDDLTGKWTGSWDITGKFGDVMEGGTALTIDPADDPFGIQDWLGENWMDPATWFDMGKEMGLGITSGDPEQGGIDIEAKLQEMLKNAGLDDFDPNNIDINNIGGGDLDSVGRIKSDVNLSDQDIQLLRDIAAREFLLNIQHVTPTASIQFGDVHETADVYEIIGVLEDMVEEHLAVSTVGG